MVEVTAKSVSRTLLVDICCPTLKASQLEYILVFSFAALPPRLTGGLLH